MAVLTDPHIKILTPNVLTSDFLIYFKIKAKNILAGGKKGLTAVIQTERADTDRYRNITLLLYTTHYIKGTAKLHYIITDKFTQIKS